MGAYKFWVHLFQSKFELFQSYHHIAVLPSTAFDLENLDS